MSAGLTPGLLSSFFSFDTARFVLSFFLFLSFFYAFSSQPAETTADKTSGLLSFLFFFLGCKLRITWFVLSFFLFRFNFLFPKKKQKTSKISPLFIYLFIYFRSFLNVYRHTEPKCFMLFGDIIDFKVIYIYIYIYICACVCVCV